jgi:hypothetical protein
LPRAFIYQKSSSFLFANTDVLPLFLRGLVVAYLAIFMALAGPLQCGLWGHGHGVPLTIEHQAHHDWLRQSIVSFSDGSVPHHNGRSSFDVAADGVDFLPYSTLLLSSAWPTFQDATGVFVHLFSSAPLADRDNHRFDLGLTGVAGISSVDEGSPEMPDLSTPSLPPQA